MTEHVLVTGGAGYIGGAAVRLLLQHICQVTVLDNLSRGHHSSLPKGVPLVVGDTGDSDCPGKLFSANRFDAVMHFAAFAGVGESMLQQAKYFQNNACATLTLLETCVANKVSNLFFPRPARFLVSRFQSDSGNDRKMSGIRMANQNCRAKRCSSGFTAFTACVYAVLRYFNAAGAWDGHGEHHEPEPHLVPQRFASCAWPHSASTYLWDRLCDG